MKEKTLKDVIKKSTGNTFESFCTRMWLDNEDENLTLPAAGNRMTRDEYVEKYKEWLLKKWKNQEL
tara:strand:- start:2518 stop:2715 length:198 start_codon:yes stop_codon:yes gene_type:complete